MPRRKRPSVHRERHQKMGRQQSAVARALHRRDRHPHGDRRGADRRRARRLVPLSRSGAAARADAGRRRHRRRRPHPFLRRGNPRGHEARDAGSAAEPAARARDGGSRCVCGPRVMTNTTTFAAAFVEALHDGLSADPRASIVGGYVLGLGPERQLMDRIRKDFPERVIDPPTSEAGVAALGIGAAMAGARPFVDLGTASFSYLAWSQLANEAAVAHYMTGGRLNVPVTFHVLHGVRGGGAAQHSHSPHAMLTNVPGLEIVAPSMPADAYGLVRAAMASPNPTLVVNHARLLGIEGPLPDDRVPLPLGKADIKRPGRDVTVLAVSLMVHYALAAADGP